MSRTDLTRRDFLRASAVAGAAALAAPALVYAKSPNAKLNVAIVGPCGRGEAQLEAAGAMENVVGVCDIDDNNLAAVARRYPKAKAYVDFRKMLDEMHKSIDAVMVSTPDHTHAPAAAMAIRLDKHCYCEKPLTHSVYETRVLAEIAKEKKLVTQMGTQIHAEDNYRRVVELIQSGAIGPVSEVLAWCGRSWGDGRRPKDTPPVPKNIHWDEWIGPAKFRPYHPCYLPANWRCWWDFGNGTLGDMACHIMDVAFWALKLRYPTTIEAEGPPVSGEGCPNKLTVRYQYPARGEMPPVKLTWYDGDNPPAFPAGYDIPNGGLGVLFIGKEGMLRADYGSRTLYPQEKFKGFKPPAPTIPASIGHHKEFFEACKTGGPTTCNFDYSGALTEAVLLGTVAYRVGKRLEWDAVNLKATNCPEADRYLRPHYRQGWTL
ncbi:MAG: Gfo/Idh/MocA family oxidoreductase [Thermoguttaceae bacterium]|jgi:predicted dehydrogenase